MNFSLHAMLLYGVILSSTITFGMRNEENDQNSKTFRTVTLEDHKSCTWGIGVNLSEIWKNWKITKSIPGEQAHNLGIQKDWEIISVDDEDINEENWRKIKAKLKGGEKMKIKFATNAILCEAGMKFSVKENMYLAKHQNSFDIEDAKTGMPDGSGLYDQAIFYFLKKYTQLEIIRTNEVEKEKSLLKIEAKLKNGETITFFAEESIFEKNNFTTVGNYNTAPTEQKNIQQKKQETLTEKHVRIMSNAILSSDGKYDKSVVAHMKKEFPNLTTEDVHKVYFLYAKPDDKETSIQSSTDIKWNCKSCTYLNNSFSNYCTMCQNPKTIQAKPDLEPSMINENQWKCASCTFLNKFFSERCEMCKKPKTVRIVSLDQVEYFTEHDVNLGNQNENTRTLMSAAANGNLEYVKKLLKDGADVKQASPQGWTALHVSIYYQHFEIIKILLEHDGTKNMNFFQKFGKCFTRQTQYVDQLTKGGCSPLDIAVTKENLEIFEYLVENGAKVNEEMMNNALENEYSQIDKYLLEHKERQKYSLHNCCKTAKRKEQLLMKTNDENKIDDKN